jgi:hypothetical protein
MGHPPLYRGTLTAAPNFAYELCAGAVDDDKLNGLDLGSLRMAASGPSRSARQCGGSARMRHMAFRPGNVPGL